MTGPLDRRTLVASHYAITGQTFNTVVYEMAKVVAECEQADVLAPPIAPARLRQELDRTSAFMSRQFGFGNQPHGAPVSVDKDYDLFVFCGSWLRDVAELRRVKNWRKRCKTAVFYCIECWPQFEKDNRPHFAELREFDLVVFTSAGVAEVIGAQSGAKVSALSSGVDAEVLCPYPAPPPRLIDVYAMGRRPASMHPHFTRMAEADPNFFYLADTAAGAFAINDFALHAAQRANILKRTKIFPCFGPNAVDNRKAREAGGFEMTPMRFFEAAASGAFVIGEPPNSEDFRADFDWEDAWAFASGIDDDYAGIVKALLADRERMARASARGVSEALRRHDWSRRWERMLSMLGMAPKPALAQRSARLEALRVYTQDEALTARAWGAAPSDAHQRERA